MVCICSLVVDILKDKSTTTILIEGCEADSLYDAASVLLKFCIYHLPIMDQDSTSVATDAIQPAVPYSDNQ